MNKVTVSVFFPALSKYYDIVLPVNMKIGMVAKLVANALSEHESIKVLSDSLIITVKDSKTILEDDITVFDAGIRDGSTLILA